MNHMGPKAGALSAGKTIGDLAGAIGPVRPLQSGTLGGRLVFQIFGALAEFERNLIRERTQAGLAAARARGRKGGRPRVLNATKTELLYKLYDEKEYTVMEVCRLAGFLNLHSTHILLKEKKRVGLKRHRNIIYTAFSNLMAVSE
jgi:DNA invertase Pin-like site-specific DNA recombinase